MRLAIFLVAASGWLTMSRPGFKILYRPGMDGFAKIIAKSSAPAKKITEKNLAFNFDQTINIAITSNDEDFRAAQTGVPEWAAATAHPAENLIFLKPLKDMSPENLAVTFRHELAHILIYHRLQGHPAARWFEEGMAVLSSGEMEFARFQALGIIGLSGRYIPFRELDSGFPADSSRAQVAYIESESFVAYLKAQLGMENFSRFLDRLAGGENFYPALEQTSGLSFDRLQENWAEQVRRRYGIIAIAGGSTGLWFLITLLFLLAYLTKKLRGRRKERLLELESIGYRGQNYQDDDPERNPEGEIKWH